MTDPATIRIYGVLADSQVNGPGRRSVVHLQGCTLGCPGCFNPESHPHAGGTLWPVDKLAQRLSETALDGVTISGGEPFQQPRALRALLRALRGKGVESIVVFTGYSRGELDDVEHAREALEHIDLLVAGRYDPTQAMVGSLLASANQQAHFLTAVHSPMDLQSGGETEISIHPDGSITMTGFPPPSLRRAVRNLGRE